MRLIPKRGYINIEKVKGTFIETREDVERMDHERSHEGQVVVTVNDEGITTVYFGERKNEIFYYYLIGLSSQTKEKIIKYLKRNYYL